MPKFVKDMSIQMREIEGIQEFNKGLYHNTNYENLIKNLKKSREEYR